MKISVVINTLNEEKNIERAIKSVSWADEVVVCDMYSTDRTVEIAKKLKAKVISFKNTGYVEPARNFAISKASNDWVLVLDADEIIGQDLAKKIQRIAEENTVDYVRIPRKNIIFRKWIQNSMWWPDYNIRLFKKENVNWSEKIHIPPVTKGEGLDLPAQEQFAITHYHYESISQYVTRLNRYTDIQAENLKSDGYQFNWKDLIIKPTGEFLIRYFANQGFKDGLHGLALSLLQAFSFVVLYLKVWEMEKFPEQEVNLTEVNQEFKKSAKEISWWLKNGNLSKNPVKRLVQKISNTF